MKAKEAPEKLYMNWVNYPLEEMQVEYTRTDAFIEKALKWYCLDCACNDNCAANHKCAFWSFFKDYLEGNDKALPPKISNAFNPDGSTTENYRYRHIIERIKDDFIEKTCEWLEKNIAELTGVDSYAITESFKQAMEK